MRRGRVTGGIAGLCERIVSGQLGCARGLSQSQGSWGRNCYVWGIECCFSTCAGFPLWESRRPHWPSYGARSERQAFCGAISNIWTAARALTRPLIVTCLPRAIACVNMPRLTPPAAIGSDRNVFPPRCSLAGPAANNVRLSLRCASSIQLHFSPLEKRTHRHTQPDTAIHSHVQ